MNNLPKDICSVINRYKFDWTQFESECSVHHDSIESILRYHRHSDFKIHEDIDTDDLEEWIYYTVSEDKLVREISREEYLDALRDYLSIGR